MEKTIHLLAVPRVNSCAVLVTRYVWADLSYHEGKTIIVFSPLFLSFAPTNLSFVFLGLDPLISVGVAIVESPTQPSAVCVHASPCGPGPHVGTDACLGYERGSVWRMKGFWLPAQLSEKMAGEVLG